MAKIFDALRTTGLKDKDLNAWKRRFSVVFGPLEENDGSRKTDDDRKEVLSMKNLIWLNSSTVKNLKILKLN
jgi:hypothetical protein